MLSAPRTPSRCEASRVSRPERMLRASPPISSGKRNGSWRMRRYMISVFSMLREWEHSRESANGEHRTVEEWRKASEHFISAGRQVCQFIVNLRSRKKVPTIALQGSTNRQFCCCTSQRLRSGGNEVKGQLTCSLALITIPVISTQAFRRMCSWFQNRSC